MARTADEAKAQAEAETKANKVKADKTKAADSAQIESLKKTFGPVGTETEGELIVGYKSIPTVSSFQKIYMVQMASLYRTEMKYIFGLPQMVLTIKQQISIRGY
jgi:hypothetical protein